MEIQIPNEFDVSENEQENHSVNRTKIINNNDLFIPDEVLMYAPKIARDYIAYASPLSDGPDEFLLTPFLASIGALTGKSRYLKLGGMTIYPVVWTVIFATSSLMRKSTALSKAKSVFKPIQKRYTDEYNNKLAEWNKKKKQAKENKESFDEPKPKKKTLYAADGFSDLTFWETLHDNGNIISYASEFTGLWTELTRSRNALSDIALQIFDAEDSVRRYTKLGGDIELNNPIWCIAGATTVATFQRSLTTTERGSGMLQRILPVTMEVKTKPFKAMTELPTPDAELYRSITERLEVLSRLKRKEVRLSPKARDLYTLWSHDLYKQSKQIETQIHDIGGYTSRLNIYGLKFALIYQVLQNDDDEISELNMQGAIYLCNWLLKHQIFMLEKNYVFNRFYADRLKVLEILERSNGILSRTELMNLSNMDKDQLDRAIDNEIMAGRIEAIKYETGGRPRYDYKLITEADDV